MTSSCYITILWTIDWFGEKERIENGITWIKYSITRDLSKKSLRSFRNISEDRYHIKGSLSIFVVELNYKDMAICDMLFDRIKNNKFSESTKNIQHKTINTIDWFWLLI